MRHATCPGCGALCSVLFCLLPVIRAWCSSAICAAVPWCFEPANINNQHPLKLTESWRGRSMLYFRPGYVRGKGRLCCSSLFVHLASAHLPVESIRTPIFHSPSLPPRDLTRAIGLTTQGQIDARGQRVPPYCVAPPPHGLLVHHFFESVILSSRGLGHVCV